MNVGEIIDAGQKYQARERPQFGKFWVSRPAGREQSQGETGPSSASPATSPFHPLSTSTYHWGGGGGRCLTEYTVHRTPGNLATVNKVK